MKQPPSGLKAWAIRKLNKTVARINGERWFSENSWSPSQYPLSWQALKPRRFADKADFAQFLSEIKNSTTHTYIHVTVGETDSKGFEKPEEAADFAAEKAPQDRLSISLSFMGTDGQPSVASIRIESKRRESRPLTLVTGERSEFVIECFDKYSKEMSFIDRHKETPILDPVSNEDESFRRFNRRSLTINTLLSSVMGALLALLTSNAGTIIAAITRLFR